MPKSAGKGAREERAAYHHRDLRRKLTEVGEQLLEERGVEGFTLRECQPGERLGFGTAHHFGNLTGLLTAIATLGIEGLSDAQESALERSDGAPGIAFERSEWPTSATRSITPRTTGSRLGRCHSTGRIRHSLWRVSAL